MSCVLTIIMSAFVVSGLLQSALYVTFHFFKNLTKRLPSHLDFLIGRAASVASEDNEPSNPPEFYPRAPLWMGQPSRENLANMSSDAKARSPWSEFAAVTAALQDINTEYISYTVHP